MATLLSNINALFLNSCRNIGRSLFPRSCLLCTAPSRDASICAACWQDLPWLTKIRCPQCALPTSNGDICGACLSHAPNFDAVTAAFAYAWPLSSLLHRYKYSGQLAMSGLLAHALASCIAGNRVDLVIPMPLAAGRLRQRGFNQALEIARDVCRRTATPLSESACRRVREGTPQVELPWAQRAKNVRGAFVCDIDLAGKRVAVIDDVMTTGATLNELARNLRKAGAIEIRGWVVARTLPR